MSSKRNHAARSRKTHRWNLTAARGALRGTLPWEIRQMYRRKLAQAVAAEAPKEEKEEAE